MELKSFSVFHPTYDSHHTYCIDEAFQREILLHICKNRIKSIDAPLILSIQGKKGEGKTTHVLKICNQLGVIVVFIHGSAISGQHEKEPADLIKAAYFEASKWCKRGKTSLLLIDDIDTSVAATIDDRRYTVNSQIVNGTLMSIANNPTMIGEAETERIPIVFTGNDLTNLYPPLRRNGRMKIFSWEPDKTTKAKIVNFIFQEIIEQDDFEDFQNLILEILNYLDKPISFFSELKSALFDDFILAIINKSGSVNFEQIDIELSAITKSKMRFEDIRSKAVQLANTSLKSYI